MDCVIVGPGLATHASHVSNFTVKRVFCGKMISGETFEKTSNYPGEGGGEGDARRGVGDKAFQDWSLVSKKTTNTAARPHNPL